jgi:peptide deformylase
MNRTSLARTRAAIISDVPDEWIRQWGDPTLREVALPVHGVDDLLRRQVERMQERMLEAPGMGLAATQVGLLRRLFVFSMSPDSEVDVLVNPRITARSADRAAFLEGCLSFDCVLVAVERPVRVRVEGQDLEGRPRTLSAEGHEASLLQHEIDHLDGILTLDRADPLARRRAVAALLDITRDRQPQAA